MRISEAKFENGWLSLKTEPTESFKWLKEFKPNDYEIVKARKRRSNNANSMAWALITQIAKRVATSPEDVYRYEIQGIPGQTVLLSIKPEALKAFERSFAAEHIGRQVKVIGEHQGTLDILCRYGSSDFDTAQMSQFIDSIIQDCKAIGIEIPDDDRVRSLLEAWECSR